MTVQHLHYSFTYSGTYPVLCYHPSPYFSSVSSGWQKTQDWTRSSATAEGIYGRRATL